ncbi:hypothetical protein VTI28DRAFT_5512 [Corynascus sepedonium]
MIFKTINVVGTLLALTCTATSLLPPKWRGPTFHSVSPPTVTTKHTTCRSLPGDADWPSTAAWAALNKTVGGRLIATVPVAHTCHGSSYNQTVCDELRVQWPLSKPHVNAPADIINPYFQNDSCVPFTPVDRPCLLGNYASYSINVTGVKDIQAGLAFARKNNIRLTIKNTGHDLLGKSTGKGSLSLWTHNLNSLQFIDAYNGDANYTGSAVRLGAGVIGSQIIEEAAARGLRVVTGICDTVGVAGGYTSGGGHGALTSLYGLSADNVLEWEVVTATGEHLIATPRRNAKLYWALSGGGAGTFAVVVSMTTRTYPDGPMTHSTLTISADAEGLNGNVDAFWAAVDAFHTSLGPVVDAGAVVTYSISKTKLAVHSAILPGGDTTTAGSKLAPIKKALTKAGVSSLAINTTSYPSWLDLHTVVWGPVLAVTPEGVISGGRMFPRSQTDSAEGAATVGRAMRTAIDAGFSVSCGAVNANTSRPAGGPENAVSPAWRATLVQCQILRTWDWDRTWAENAVYQTALTEKVMPAIEAASPGGGSYLNEANFADPNWQEGFYGINYPALLAIKRKYDPESLLYARTAVGSEVWAEDANQRLCRTSRH